MHLALKTLLHTRILMCSRQLRTLMKDPWEAIAPWSKVKGRNSQILIKYFWRSDQIIWLIWPLNQSKKNVFVLIIGTFSILYIFCYFFNITVVYMFFTPQTIMMKICNLNDFWVSFGVISYASWWFPMLFIGVPVFLRT